MESINFMIDFETLGANQGDCKVLCVSYTHFVLDSDESLEVKDELDDILKTVKTYYFDPELQTNYKADPATIEWWKKQDAHIIKEAFSGVGTGNTVKDFCIQFRDYVYDTCREYGIKHINVWARGTSFDITVLERLYADSGVENPFPFWVYKDSRSFIAAYNLVLNDNLDTTLIDTRLNLHDSRYDVALEVMQVKHAYNSLSAIHKDFANQN